MVMSGSRQRMQMQAERTETGTTKAGGHTSRKWQTQGKSGAGKRQRPRYSRQKKDKGRAGERQGMVESGEVIVQGRAEAGEDKARKTGGGGDRGRLPAT